MRTILMIILAAMTYLSAGAYKYSYSFNNTPISEAIVKISKDNPEINISFIYKELDNYKTSAKIDTDDAYEALAGVIGLNPITITTKRGSFYIEALQHGKYMYNGSVVDAGGEPVVAATVMFQNPGDSTVITYGLTDGEGLFSIPCDKRDVIAKISCLGYLTTYRNLDSFNAGTITMHENAIKLPSVTVEEEAVTAYSDKTVYVPNKRQKSAAQKAIDLLRFMAIPQIRIKPTNNTVTDNFGQEVVLYVNGLEASEGELEGLRTADVRRVEYLEFPTDPRYRGAHNVINFVVQEYVFGGYTMASVSENFLIGLSSRANMFSKFSYGRMKYDLYAGTSNYSSHHIGSSLSGNYRLKSKDGEEIVAGRDETLDRTRYKQNQIPVTFRATYRTDKMQIRSLVGFVHDNTPVSDIEGNVIFSQSDYESSKFRRINPTLKNSAIYSGSYVFMLPKNYSLDITPSFSYTHTNDRYLYSVNDYQEVRRNANEDAYNFSISASASKFLGGGHSLTAGINGGQWNNNLKYTGTNQYSDKFRLSFAYGNVGYNYYTSKVFINANLGVMWEGSDINKITKNDVYPFTHIYVKNVLSKKHTLSAYFQYATNSPTISKKASDILQENEYLYITGNPYLKNSRHITVNLQYMWIASKKFNMSAYGKYYGNYNRNVTVYSPYKDGFAVIRGYENSGNYNLTNFGINANLTLFNGKLQLSAGPEQYFYKSTGIYSNHYNPFILNAQAVLYLGQFYASVNYATPERQLRDNTNDIYRSRNFHSIEGGWSNSSWFIKLTAADIFNKGWVGATLTMNSDYYSEYRVNYGTAHHSRLNITVTYTINYGKKVQRGAEVSEQSATSSGILK